MERETPSCFSSRIERVRRCNSLESFRLKGKIETLEAQRAIQHFIISREQTVIRKELTRIHELKKPPETSAERRRLFGKRAHPLAVSAETYRLNINRDDVVHRRTLSEPTSSVSVGVQLPALPVRRKDSVSLTRARLQELDNNNAEGMLKAKGPGCIDPEWKQFPHNGNVAREASCASVVSLSRTRTQTSSSMASSQPQRSDCGTGSPSGHGTLRRVKTCSNILGGRFIS